MLNIAVFYEYPLITFGVPVEPEVYIMIAVSSGVGGAAIWVSWSIDWLDSTSAPCKLQEKESRTIINVHSSSLDNSGLIIFELLNHYKLLPQ